MAAAITFALSNFTLTCFIFGLVAAAIALAAQRPPRPQGVVVEALLAWFLFFSIGVSLFYNFVMHVFFGKMTASFIGWADSPFQAEVGYASLGFALVGFMAFAGNRGLRIAAIVGPTCFLWGAAVGHVIDMVRSHNFAPGNAGVVFWTDILLPVFGLVLLAMSRNGHDRPARGRM